MTSLRLALSALTISLFAAWSASALGDVPPADACSAAAMQVGAPCNNAGPNNDQPGTCANGMCPHTTITPDGGAVVTMNPCVICVEASSTSASSGSSSSGTGGSESSSPGGGGCAVGAGPAEGMTSALILGGLGVLLVSRRRRRV